MGVGAKCICVAADLEVKGFKVIILVGGDFE